MALRSLESGFLMWIKMCDYVMTSYSFLAPNSLTEDCEAYAFESFTCFETTQNVFLSLSKSIFLLYTYISLL